MKLRAKSSTPIHADTEHYTLGSDYILDQELLPYDIQGSIAHVSMLHTLGILSINEKETLHNELGNILELWKQGVFTISRDQEDMHTAIEHHLTIKLGDLGKKIHTGRSRNDQVLTALRLYMKDFIHELDTATQSLIKALDKKSSQYQNILMPGYTHMQRAMPSSVSMWLGSYHDSLCELMSMIQPLYSICNQNPLGSVAGYGETSLGINREVTTQHLGFGKTQKNPMYCAQSRGKFERYCMSYGNMIMLDTAKLASDLLLYSTKEFGFISLPDAFTTGSSVMPQKKNYDVLELIRGNVSIYNGYTHQVRGVINTLTSGYHRDFQLTKEPFLRSCSLIIDTLHILTQVITHLECNTKKMKKACSQELYATQEAYTLVKQGVPFREAYQIISKKYQ